MAEVISAVVVAALAIAGVILQAIKDTTDERRKRRLKRLAIVMGILSAVGIIFTAVLNYYGDESRRSENLSLKDSVNAILNNVRSLQADTARMVRDSLTQERELKRSGIFYDSLLNKYFKAEPDRAFVNVLMDSLHLQKIKGDSFRIRLPLINHGPKVAMGLRYNVFVFHKKGNRLQPEGRIVEESEMMVANAAVSECNYCTTPIKFEANPSREDSLFIKFQYHWDNPIKNLPQPVTEYFYWTADSKFKIAKPYHKALFDDVDKRATIIRH